MKKHKHYWLCSLTGMMAGFVAVFISTHEFELHWPFNMPLTWEQKRQEIVAQTPVTETSVETVYVEYKSLSGEIKVGDRVLVLSNSGRFGAGQFGVVDRITEASTWPFRVKFDNPYRRKAGEEWEAEWFYDESELKRVKKHNH